MARTLTLWTMVAAGLIAGAARGDDPAPTPPTAASEPAAAAVELKDWADLDARLKALPGKVGFAVYEVRMLESASTPGARNAKLALVHGMNADQRLAIASAMKLYILGAVADGAAGGTIGWDDRVVIQTTLKSMGSGELHDVEAGKPFAVRELALRMMQADDNTAADHLLHHVGREKVEAYMARLHARPAVNTPFLATRELFALRLTADNTLPARWRGVSTEIKRDMLLPDDPVRPTRPFGESHNPGEVAAFQPGSHRNASWSTPRDIETIGWFASPEECCRLMGDLARLAELPGNEPLKPILAAGTGEAAGGGEGRTVLAFKSGREPGVLSLNWLVSAGDKVYGISAGWNDPAKVLDERRLVELAEAALRLVK